MEEIMVGEKLYETNENTLQRENVLKELEKIVKNWVAEETKNQQNSVE